MPYVETARGTLYFAEHRRDDQPPLLLIHGAAGTHLDWSMPVRKLGAIAADLNGHGKSAGAGRESIAEHAADMLALLDALGVEKAFICGHSMGGAVALHIALEHPDRVRGLMLLATGARLKVHPDILANAETNPEAVADILFGWLWSDGTPDAARARGRAAYLAQNPLVVARDYRASDGFDVRDRLDEIRLPALVMGGTADVMTPLKYSQFLADHIPGASLRTYDGAGHNLQLERAAEVAADMQEFIARY